jgi:hypothetical protein
VWYLFAAKNDDCHMLRCLTELESESIPYWDDEFAAWAADDTRWRADYRVLEVGDWVAEQRVDLESKRLGAGGGRLGGCGRAGGDASGVSVVCYSVVH